MIFGRLFGAFHFYIRRKMYYEDKKRKKKMGGGMMYDMKPRNNKMGGGRMNYADGGSVSRYADIYEKEKKCVEMVGYNTMKISGEK
tara:strand:+ start:2323 stop:2580 length:258 start_codon:yes stop_codon:yes gene_type:complete